jgi:hypothetical protein
MSQPHNSAQEADLSPDFKATLECLREAVAEALERKRRLGHYSVQWIDGRPQCIGEDAPEEGSPTSPPGNARVQT